MHKNQLGFSEALYQYTIAHSQAEPDILRQLREAKNQHPQARMQISPDQGQFMALLLQLMNAKRVLEIGTFTGYSSLAMALALPADGQLITCDINPKDTAIAAHYWQLAGVQEKITLHLAPALETLDRLIAESIPTFDFAFIDADKGNYWNYCDRVLQLLRPGGLIAIDNTLWSGRVADPENQEKITLTIRTFNQQLAQDPRVEVSLLPIADGLTLARKR
jgi:predicted O-methyltransferase YrrM